MKEAAGLRDKGKLAVDVITDGELDNYIPKVDIEKIYHKVGMMYNDQRNKNQCARMNVTKKIEKMLADVLGFNDKDSVGKTYI